MTEEILLPHGRFEKWIEESAGLGKPMRLELFTEGGQLVVSFEDYEWRKDPSGHFAQDLYQLALGEWSAKDARMIHKRTGSVMSTFRFDTGNLDS